MRRKRGYVSVEALIIAGAVTVAGFAILVAAKDSMAIASARVLGLTYKFTQDMENKLESPLAGRDVANGEWNLLDGEEVKEVVSDGQVPVQEIMLNISQIQILELNSSIEAVASITNSPLTSGQVIWTVLSGHGNIIVSCTSAGSNCLSATITAIKEGTAIIRVSSQNHSVYKDIAITIPEAG